MTQSPPPPQVTQPRDGELAQTTLHLAGHTVLLWHIQDLDAFLARLLAEHPIIPDDDIPYYAWIWPSALVLAESILRGPPLDGVRALELGCGTGLVGLCAALHGAQVTLTDLQPGALTLAQRNAAQAGVAGRVDARLLDWRNPDVAPVPLLLVSDVLYEARFAQPLANAVAGLLAPGGQALLADPERPHLHKFVDQARALGLDVLDGPVIPKDGASVHLYQVQWRAHPSLAPPPWQAAPAPLGDGRAPR